MCFVASTDWLVFMSGVSVILRVTTLGRGGAILRVPSKASPNVRVLNYSQVYEPVVSGGERSSQHLVVRFHLLLYQVCTYQVHDNSQHGLEIRQVTRSFQRRDKKQVLVYTY